MLNYIIQVYININLGVRVNNLTITKQNFDINSLMAVNQYIDFTKLTFVGRQADKSALY